MERALVQLSAGRAVQPPRTVLPVADHDGLLFVMPAYAGALGAKLVTLYPNNREAPTHHALILLFDPETGAPVAVIDGRLITELRTAAVSAVATRQLARQDARVLAILGSGVQARSHLEAMRLVRDLDEVRVWSPRGSNSFAREHGVVAAASARDAVEGADLIVTATSSREPVLDGAWLKPGAHLNSVGAPRPDWRELDDEVLRRSRIYVDSAQACGSESGDVIAAGQDRIVAEIGEVVAGSRPGRGSEDEITLFKSVGLAVEDMVTAGIVLGKAFAGRP